jgi:hypothetical protein
LKSNTPNIYPESLHNVFQNNVWLNPSRASELLLLFESLRKTWINVASLQIKKVFKGIFTSSFSVKEFNPSQATIDIDIF